MTDFQEGNLQVVAFIHGMHLKKVPAGVVEQARTCLSDLIGACIAGRHAGGAAILLGLVREQFNGAADATVIGAGCKTSCASAALVNGFSANALDIDDGHRLCKGYPGAVIFPAVLGAAEKIAAIGETFLEALIIGYEVAIRTSLIMQKHCEYCHGSGAWGAVGAAVESAANPERSRHCRELRPDGPGDAQCGVAGDGAQRRGGLGCNGRNHRRIAGAQRIHRQSVPPGRCGAQQGRVYPDDPVG